MSRKRIEVLHGVNLDQLGRRDPGVYGTFTLAELETQVHRWASDLGCEVTFWQTNHEGEFCETLHEARDRADGLILNPGAWTHYSYAIRDALEVSGLPAVEIHISEVASREHWRRESVIGDLCVGRVQGEGADGYRHALEILSQALGG